MLTARAVSSEAGKTDEGAWALGGRSCLRDAELRPRGVARVGLR
jgi:hypothetical protein